MSIQTTWVDDDHHILLMRFEGAWTGDELKTAIYYVHALHKFDASVPHHIIVDFTSTPILPIRALQQLQNFVNLIGPLRKEYGYVVFVGASRLLRAVGNLLSQGFPRTTSKIYNVNTYSDALALIENVSNKRFQALDQLSPDDTQVPHEPSPEPSAIDETQASDNMLRKQWNETVQFDTNLDDTHPSVSHQDSDIVH